jgi:hypothetical protein
VVETNVVLPRVAVVGRGLDGRQILFGPPLRGEQARLRFEENPRLKDLSHNHCLDLKRASRTSGR